MFTKTGLSSPPSLKKASKVSLTQLGNTAAALNDPTVALVRLDTRHVLPDDQDKEVDRESEVNGYRFGRENIPFEDSDAPLLLHTVGQGMVCMGFVPSSSVPERLSMGGCDVVEAAPGLLQVGFSFGFFGVF